jgi:hypothetical protein
MAAVMEIYVSASCSSLADVNELTGLFFVAAPDARPVGGPGC